MFRYREAESKYFANTPARVSALTILITTARPSSPVCVSPLQAFFLLAPLFIDNSFFFSPTDGELYAGTVSDFSGLDPLIYKDPLRTEQYDFKHLNGI